MCDAFPRPEFQIRGASSYDQDWADRTTEAGVAGCKWQRPVVRPPQLDAAVAIALAPKPAPKAKKASIWNRVKSKFGKKPKLPERLE